MRWKKTRNLAFDKRTSRSAGKSNRQTIDLFIGDTKAEFSSYQKAVEYQPDHF